MRITISWEEASELRTIINAINYGIELSNEQKELLKAFDGQLREEMSKIPSEKKIKATEKATDTRVKAAKLKIFNALNMMRMEGKKINLTAVAREAGVSYNTAKKYRAVIEAEKNKNVK
jgi:L-rhamnose mutarotase